MTETEPQFSRPRVAAGDWAYYPQVKELCELRFGTGYLDETDFARWMEHPDLVQIVLVDQDFAGVAVLLPASTEEIARKMGMTVQDVEAITRGQPALIYKCAALWPWYEKRGINHAVAADGLRRAEAGGYSAVFSAAWIYDGKTPARSVFEHMGFTPLYRRKMLWYGDERYRCIVCGGRCTCDAMIYYKKLGGNACGES